MARNFLSALFVTASFFFCAGLAYAANSVLDQQISQFLASAQLGDSRYDFDHNHDGIVDMSIYPLRIENPDPGEEYITLNMAIESGELILREDPRNYLTTHPYGRGITSQVPRFGILGTQIGQQIIFVQVGQAYRGGGQGRGSRRGGLYGRSERGPLERTYASSNYKSKSDIASLFGVGGQEFEVDVLCFEKRRSIAKSMGSGDSEFFSYAGMASPSIRKKIVLLPTQRHINKSIKKELKQFDIDSRTYALNDIFTKQDVKEILDYYAAGSRRILDEDKGASGMIVTGSERILCMDLYCSADLFEKMFPELVKSAALEVYKTQKKARYYSKTDVEAFLYDAQQARGWRRYVPQVYRHISSELIGGAVKAGPQVVHVEMYPRK